MLTISQLASYAGVTVRAVRHYHAKGLLPEPERDRSGYRRYDALAVADLIKIRTLAEAGVPLSRVRELLAADKDEFATAVVDIDRRLRAEIRERQDHRKRIAQLAAGDNLALPPEAVAYLARMRELGFPKVMIDGERDAWILVAAQVPEHMSTFMALKEGQLDDPAVVESYREMADAIFWRPDDPRIEGIADQIVGFLEAADPAEMEAYDAQIPDDLVELLDSVFLDMVPMAARLLELIEERGWTGWTRQQRIDAPDA